MPIHTSIEKESYVIKIWKIEESLSYFETHTVLKPSEQEEYATISHQERKKQWLACRFLIKQIFPNACILKDEHGKPFLKEINKNISISHCTNFAAIILHPTENVGIDIEPIHEKVHKISSRFLSEKELEIIKQSCNNDDDLTKKFIAYWAAKESVYKWHGRKQLSFKNQICIQSFSEKFFVDPTFINLIATENIYTIKIFFLIIENCILAYTFKN